MRANRGLDSGFYNTGGGVFDPVLHYEEMFVKK